MKPWTPEKDEAFRHLRVEEGYSIYQLADHFDCSEHAVKRAINRLGIKGKKSTTKANHHGERQHFQFRWTEEAVETLRRMTAEKYSGEQIASVLGCTKNAALAKRRKLGIISPLGSRSNRSKKPKRGPRRSLLTIGGNPLDNGHRVKPWMPADTEPRPDNLLSIYDLTERTCKWMYGHPGEADAGFCGERTAAGSSYCGAHHRRVYVRDTEAAHG